MRSKHSFVQYNIQVNRLTQYTMVQVTSKYLVVASASSISGFITYMRSMAYLFGIDVISGLKCLFNYYFLGIDWWSYHLWRVLEIKGILGNLPLKILIKAVWCC